MLRRSAFFTALCALPMALGLWLATAPAALAQPASPILGTGFPAFVPGIEGDAPVISSRLVASHSVVAPGQKIGLAWEFTLNPHWHVYWQNPGDSGLPATLKTATTPQLELPLAYPVPQVISVPPITNYGYENKVTLHTTFTVPATLPAGVQTLAFAGRFLYCKDVCLPGSVALSLPLRVGQPGATLAQANPAYVPAAPLPPVLEGATATLNSQTFTLTLPQSFTAPTARFLPAEEGTIDDSAPQTLANGVLTLKRDEQAPTPPAALKGLLLVGDRTFTIDIPLQQRGMHTETAPAPNSPQTAAVPESSAPPPLTGLGSALFFAFVAGLLLNLMPCVLPVLSLKLLGLVQTHKAANRRAHLVAYSGGVLASFAAFACLMALLRLGGLQLGWGFHLQNPTFVAGLTLLMLAVALNFFGVYEVGAGLSRLGGKPGGEGSLTASFGTGILAVVVATPCTVPFMGGAMAYALTQPLLPSLAVFLSLGAGMALPFVLAIPYPQVFGFLPKPGKWMPAFRHALGWPMLATALWLLYVFANQTTTGATFTVLGLAALLAFGLWLKGAHPSTFSNVLVATIALGALLLVRATLAPHDAPAANWQPWSPTAVQEARQTRPVLVDFTADWCVTCKVTELTVFKTAATQTLLTRHNVALFKADWTRADPAITAELARHGRKGVPLYLLYRKGEASPTLLPQLLTYGVLEKALEPTR